MKIIAKINDNNFLIEISEYELNFISGRDCGTSRSIDTYFVNQSIMIQENWKYLSGVLSKKEEISSQARNLRSMADMLESIPLATAESLQSEINK